MAYVQCTLRRGQVRHVSWIPHKYAKYGRLLRLREGDEWQDGWIVEAVHSFTIQESELPYVVAQVRNHRRATGDADRRAT